MRISRARPGFSLSSVPRGWVPGTLLQPEGSWDFSGSRTILMGSASLTSLIKHNNFLSSSQFPAARAPQGRA